MTLPLLDKYLHQNFGEMFVSLRDDGQLSCELDSNGGEDIKVSGVSIESCLQQLERRLQSAGEQGKVVL